MKANLSKIFLLYVISSMLITSCIPTKKVVYLENFDGRENEQYEALDWEYKVQPGDRLFVKIEESLQGLQFGASELASDNSKNQRVNVVQQSPSVYDFIVDENGMLNLPIIGKVEAEGKTFSELRETIIQSCKGIISDPTVKLYMTNYNVTLLGEFNAPGFYQLITERPTFFDAVGLGGDLTDFADRRRIKLIRKIDGKVNVYYLDVTDPNFVTSTFYYILPNDVIHVMPLKVKKYSSDNALPLLLSGLTVIITLANLLNNR